MTRRKAKKIVKQEYPEYFKNRKWPGNASPKELKKFLDFPFEAVINAVKRMTAAFEKTADGFHELVKAAERMQDG